MKYHGVIGMQFGDEGKGMVTDYLCGQVDATPEKVLVIRFNGGHQAAHTVCHQAREDAPAKRHVFSTIGSGALRGCHSYWSKKCTVDPYNILAELSQLETLDCRPVLFIDPRAPVTTPYDRLANQKDEANLAHGTCGHGVGKTMQRQQDYYQLRMVDLFYPWLVRQKLAEIEQYYKQQQGLKTAGVANGFLKVCQQLIDHDSITVQSDEIMGSYNHVIYEGAQGLMLDPEYGIFPYVTRSRTGLSQISGLPHPQDVYMVARAYLVRHGNGPHPTEHLKEGIVIPDTETNVQNQWQGKLRHGILDLTMLAYSWHCDPILRKVPNRVLVLTCLDHLESYRYQWKGDTIEHLDEQTFISNIAEKLKPKKVLISRNQFPQMTDVPYHP